MRTLAAWLILAGLAVAQTAAPPSGPSRAELRSVERLCDKAMETYAIDTIEQMTHARALWIEGYGVLITMDVNLTRVSPLIGFAGGLSKAQKDRIRENKQKRLPEFRAFLEGMLLEATRPLEHLSADDHLMLSVDLIYAPYEDSAGMPTTLSIVAKKKDLLEAAERKTPSDQLAGILKVKME